MNSAFRFFCALAVACGLAGILAAADLSPVPTVQVTDLFRPHNDPDDHWDLATQFALYREQRIDLRGILIDYPKAEWAKAPDVEAVAQLNHICGCAVPVVTGVPQILPAEPLRDTANTTALAGVRAFLEWLRQSPQPVVMHVVGSCRDVALALRLEPDLFARQCAAIYLNAGSGSPDLEKARRLEYNVGLDPANYAALFQAPCPVYWLPCFEYLSPEPKQMWRVAEYGSFFRFRQSEILPQLSTRLQNYFLAMYAGGRTANGLWLQQLAAAPVPEVLAAEGARDRNMWCTAGFLHAVGLTVTQSGEIRPREGASSPVFRFEPVRITCNAEGVTSWLPDPQSKNRFLLRVTDVEHYAAAMTVALRSLLTKLP